MSCYNPKRSTYLYSDYNACEPPEYSGGNIYCEVCDLPVPAEDAAPDGLCFDCYADRLIDGICDCEVRDFVSRNRGEFIAYLRWAV
ncbi:MAG: hypothetical protein ACI4XF_02500 [Oscillospiraceae bacterium]